ncbi:MAG: methyltransferase domain-containing protein [Chloroflexi bacterium]|nr:methyltransferase domain-containing protein [Chloroflexota bacterium]
MLALTALRATIRDRVPSPLLAHYRRTRRWARELRDRARVRLIPLDRVLVGGEQQYDAGQWADLVDDPRRASLPLHESPCVHLLQLYCGGGPAVLDLPTLRSTPYYRNALARIRYTGHYFGQVTEAGIQAQAAAFLQLYDRIRCGDPTEVAFPSPHGHSARGSLPMVYATWTPNTYQVVDGLHRLAIAWMLGQRRLPAVVTGVQPTELQRLVLRVSATQNRRELYQPLNTLDFDASWPLIRCCEDRLSMMLAFLEKRKIDIARSSMIDLACSYGWFVAEFARRGAAAIGVDSDPNALKIGRIAYGLSPSQLYHSYIQGFLELNETKYDIVLCLSILHHFARAPIPCDAATILHKIDAITGKVLFLDTGESHEEWFRATLPEWNPEYVARFVKQHTSFTHIVPLGTDRDNERFYKKNYGRTLFACFR